MRIWVQYHNTEAVGREPEGEFIETEKSVPSDIENDVIFLIEGSGQPREYQLWSRQQADYVEKVEGGYAVYCKNESIVKAPLKGEDFNEFKRRVGNFGLGFQNITDDPFAETLVELSGGMPSDTPPPVNAPAGYLLTWDPNRVPFSRLEKFSQMVVAKGHATTEWSVGPRVKSGDRVFLMRHGEESSGLIGSGIVVSDSKEGPHWDPDKSKEWKSFFADIRWEVFREFPLIDLQELIASTGEKELWTTHGSGLPMTHELTNSIESIWADRVAEGQPNAETDADEPRPLVYLSYSHQDTEWTERILHHLSTYEERFGFEVWHDSLLETGEEWALKIQQVRESSIAAIIVLSERWLDSETIQNDDWPHLRELASRGRKLLPIVVSACNWSSAEIGRFTLFPSRGEPVDERDDQEQVLREFAEIVSRTVDEIRRRPLPPSPPAPPAPVATRDDPSPPAPRLHRDRWTIEDQLGYQLYARAITEFIKHEETEPPLVISVEAPWGQGKTSLMRMVQERLDCAHPELADEPRSIDEVDVVSQSGNGGEEDFAPSTSDQSDAIEHVTFDVAREWIDKGTEWVATQWRPSRLPPFVTVWFNAWKYQSSEQIWAGLAHGILSQLTGRLENDLEREKFWLRLQLKRVNNTAIRQEVYRVMFEKLLPRLLLVAVGIAGIGLGLGLWILASTLQWGPWLVGAGGVTTLVACAGTVARGWWSLTTSKGEALAESLSGQTKNFVHQPDYEGKMGFLHLVEQDMRKALELLVGDKRSVVIFVDDLDRCSPKKVADVIEAINLFISGNFPQCYFVLGIDAEVIAASMEVAHENIIAKMARRQSELGWKFMDKFVQLPFVIPQPLPRQQKQYLQNMFGMNTPNGDEPDSKSKKEAVDQVEELVAAHADKEDSEEQAAKAVDKLPPDIKLMASKAVMAVKERQVIARAKRYRDDDPQVAERLFKLRPYLADSPRTMKRVVNLYRFHRVMADARTALELPSANPTQIAAWSLVIVRWPSFVRWLQVLDDTRDADKASEEEFTSIGVLQKVVDAAQATSSVQEWTTKLTTAKIAPSASWTSDTDLWHFLKHIASDSVDLALAPDRGLW